VASEELPSFVSSKSCCTCLRFGISCFVLLFQLSKWSNIKKKKKRSSLKEVLVTRAPPTAAAEGQGGQLRAPPPPTCISSSARAHASELPVVPSSRLEGPTALAPLSTKQNFQLDLLKSLKPIQLMHLFSLKVLNSLLQILKRQLSLAEYSAKNTLFSPMNKQNKCFCTPSLTDCIKASS